MHVMHSGRIIQSGTPHEIAEAPATTEVAKLLGTYNLLPNNEVIQHKHVQVQPATHGVAIQHIYRQPNGVLVEFANNVRAQLPAIDETVKSWSLQFPVHNILKLPN
jgi:ABC-type Fe3+/spermidine/putrescine transport system ATPase subunit